MSNTAITADRLRSIVGRFKNASIMVVGDAMLDEYMWGSVNRISPEAPVPVVEVESVTQRLGGAANVVQNLGKLGAEPFLVSLIGRDYNGERLRSMLGGIGATDEGLCVSDSRPTTTKTRVMARQQQIVRTDQERTGDLDSLEAGQLWSAIEKKIATVSGVIISDYGKGVISKPLIGKLVERCTSAGLFVAIDPKERHFEHYSGVSVMTPNLKEAHTMAGMPYRWRTDEEIREIGWKILDQLKLKYLLITLSERGMALFEQNGRAYSHLPTVAQKVYDVTGAGDTVISVFSVAGTCGATPYEAAFLANHAAGLTVAELGTASVDPGALLADCISALP